MSHHKPVHARRANLNYTTERLERAVSRLTDSVESYRFNTWIRVPSLYQQLVDALGSHITGSGRSVGKSFPPVWDEAEELKITIDTAADIWPTGSAGTVPTRFRALARRAWDIEDVRRVRRLADIIDAYCDDIETLLSGDHIKYVTAACPACGTETVEKHDSAGELVRSPALQIVTEQGATCQACDASWTPDRYLTLVDQLGFDRPAGVLK